MSKKSIERRVVKMPPKQKLKSSEAYSLVKTEDINLCPVCNSNDLKLWCEAYDRLYKISEQKFIYSQCNRCKLIFLSLRPVEREISGFYPDSYGPYISKSQAKIYSDDFDSPKTKKLLKKVKRKLERSLRLVVNFISDSIYPDRLISKLEEFYKPRAKRLKLLDFGCGSDKFLNSARDMGWNTIGLDFSEFVVQNISDSGHKALLMSPEVWNEIEDESLDFVRMSHVLEHLYHPQEVLEAIKLKMKPGAKLNIIVPNPQGISAKIFRSRWWDLDCPRHIMLFSPSVLKNLLFDVGFSHNLEILPQTSTNDLAKTLGIIMYDLGLIEHKAISEMIHNKYLAFVLRIPMRIACAFAMPDRFHILINK